MTTPSTPRKAGPFNGNGVAVSFPFTFKIFAASDVKVAIANSAGVETVLVEGTDYTVTPNADQDATPGGTVTYPVSGSPLPVGSVLSVIGDLDYDQPLDLPSGGNFSPIALENQLDRATMQIQQLKEQVDRAAKLPQTATVGDLESIVDGIVRLADSADNIDAVVGSLAAVNIVAADITDVSTVAASIGNVNATGANIAAVVTVANDLNEPVSEINTVAGSIANVDAVGGNIANVNTVAGISPAVSTVAGVAPKVSIVADNVADVSNFADVYYGPSATNPTLRKDGSALQGGDLYFNTGTRRLRVYDGTAWVDGPVNAGTIASYSLSGTGSQTAFTLPVDPVSENNTQVYIGGVYQSKSEYGVSGTTLTFSSAPPAGANNIEVVVISTLALGATDAALVGFKQSGTGAVARTAQDKLREVVSVKDFGAVGNGVTNDSAAIQAAIDAVSSAGGGVLFFPKGDYVATGLVLKSNVTFKGAGRAISRLVIPSGNTTTNTIFYSVTTPVSNIKFESLGFRGRWDEIQNEIASNGLMTAKFVTNLTVNDCHFLYSAGFSLNLNECDHVEVTNNLMEYVARDMVAVWGTPNVKVTGNTLRHNDDDGVSINWETAGSNPVRSNIIVHGNILEDTGPIRTQAPKNVSIIGNVISRPKGTGVIVGVSNISQNDISSGHGVVVAYNIITDVIERQWFVSGDLVGSINNRVYIHVRSIKPQAGSLAVAPGEVNPATGTVQSPYDWYYKKANTSPVSGSIRAPDRFVITNNVCKRTLPAVAKYSDWGYGKAFSLDGMVDFQVTEAVLSGAGVLVRMPQTGLVVSDNTIEASGNGIRFDLDLEAGVTLVDGLAKGVLIRNNVIKNALEFGIYWVPTASLTHQDITFDNNIVDCDPYFLSTNRAAGGAWTSGGAGPTALRFVNLAGITIKNNEVRNCAAAIDSTGATTLQNIESNIIVGDAAATGFSASNKGVGTVPPISAGEQWWIRYVNSDPTSADYGDSLGANLRNASSIPSSGKWLTGMVVRARTSGASGSAGSRYVLLGWTRLTTGTGNVLNTDWVEMRCPTGT